MSVESRPSKLQETLLYPFYGIDFLLLSATFYDIDKSAVVLSLPT